MMNRHTGRPISMLEHIKQSIIDIITTPLGSRVMRRDYGSRLFDLIDAPTNAKFNADIYHATAEAITRWEPRVKIKKVSLKKPTRNQVLLDLEAWLVLKSGQRLPFSINNIPMRGDA